MVGVETQYFRSLNRKKTYMTALVLCAGYFLFVSPGLLYFSFSNSVCPRRLTCIVSGLFYDFSAVAYESK